MTPFSLAVTAIVVGALVVLGACLWLVRLAIDAGSNPDEPHEESDPPELLGPERAAGLRCFSCDHFTWRDTHVGVCRLRPGEWVNKAAGCTAHTNPSPSP